MLCQAQLLLLHFHFGRTFTLGTSLCACHVVYRWRHAGQTRFIWWKW